MRAPVGRRPAVFRRPAFRSKHVALASELFRQSPGAGVEELIHSLAEGWRAQLTAMPASELAAMLGAVDGGSDAGNDDSASVTQHRACGGGAAKALQRNTGAGRDGRQQRRLETPLQWAVAIA